MSRLHRKCLVASTAVHGLLLLVLVVSSAFMDSRPLPFELPLLDVIPDKIVDAALHGGGNPEAQPTAPPPVVTPAPVKAPEPERRKPAPEPTPEPVLPAKRPEVSIAKEKPPPKKPPIKVVTQPTRVSPPTRRTETPKVQPNVANELASRFSDTASRLSRQLTAKTSIGVPGPGGEAFANYSQVVISIYERAWIKPVGIERTAVVKATVTVARDGRVLSARITKLSGNRTVDDSVDQVLQRVKEIRPFPEGAKDDTRKFDLNFELTPVEMSG
jgi:TonB family protein